MSQYISYLMPRKRACCCVKNLHPLFFAAFPRASAFSQRDNDPQYLSTRAFTLSARTIFGSPTKPTNIIAILNTLITHALIHQSTTFLITRIFFSRIAILISPAGVYKFYKRKKKIFYWSFDYL